MSNSMATVDIDGHRIRLTNLDKVMYPATGTTKGEVIDYYHRVAAHFIAHSHDRPVTRKRWVEGVGTADQPGEVFFHKNLPEKGTPAWVQRRAIEHSDRTVDYPIANDAATLVWFGQMAALELHVPQWRFGADGAPLNPDRLVLDLDPGPGAGLDECVAVAFMCKEILEHMQMPVVPVTSGSKGIHLYAPLDGRHTSADVSAMAHELARVLEADHPDLIVSDMKKSLRGGKVLLDWSQNNGNKTTIAPYSLRGRDEPTVAVPRTWEEMAPGLRHLRMDEVLQRLADIGDPMAEVFGTGPDRLATYRSMRDGARTPEPVPSGRPAARDGRTFVIQEHHARRLHYDLRLERDGVLVSWAVPKGPPLSSAQNHLAVATEDHPLEYGSFEGTIPKGEYGAGDVTIWDSGTYKLEKWRDGKEVIFVLHGQPDGPLRKPRRYALIHTAHGDNDKNWLIHLMDDQPEELPSRTPMLATAGTVSDLRQSAEWVYEVKWDGYRAIATIVDGVLDLRSRRGIDMTGDYPELGELLDLAEQHQSLVLDGEIIVLDSAGRPSFELLQERPPGAKVHFMAFDLLYIDGESLVGLPYDQRRARLEAVLTEGVHVHLPPTFGDDLEVAMQTSQELGLEGIVAKRRTSTYQPGNRSRAWLKIKHVRMQEVVVIGWRPGNGARSKTVGSLLVAVPTEDGLRYAGRVGSGFSDRQLREAMTRLEKLASDEPAVPDVPVADARDAHWVRPELVGEVTFAEWTSVGRLRQPVWRGWRADKTPDEVPVINMGA